MKTAFQAVMQDKDSLAHIAVLRLKGQGRAKWLPATEKLRLIATPSIHVPKGLINAKTI